MCSSSASISCTGIRVTSNFDSSLSAPSPIGGGALFVLHLNRAISEQFARGFSAGFELRFGLDGLFHDVDEASGRVVGGF